MLFRGFINRVYDDLLGLGDDATLEMGNHDGTDHPVGSGLQLTDQLSAHELQEEIRKEVEVDLLQGEDPRLAGISMTFIDEDGVSREWSVGHTDCEMTEENE